MAQPTYLTRQRQYLRQQLQTLPQTVRQRHARYLQSAQSADGGFAGRQGETDPYYTAFGLWGLALLDALTAQIGARARAFLEANFERARNLVDFFSLLHGYRLTIDDALPAPPTPQLDLVASMLETCRTPDGGYGRVPGLREGSTYATFLAVLAYEEIDRPLPEPDRVLSFTRARQREDGGYVEIPPMKRSGTNPTAAAQAVIQILEPEKTPAAKQRDQATAAFLLNLASLEGGLLANNRIPLADLLSTFTGLWTLQELGARQGLDIPKAARYLLSLERPEGGFLAGLWDEQVDVEYTLYGLGSMALLTEGISSVT